MGFAIFGKKKPQEIKSSNLIFNKQHTDTDDDNIGNTLGEYIDANANRVADIFSDIAKVCTGNNPNTNVTIEKIEEVERYIIRINVDSADVSKLVGKKMNGADKPGKNEIHLRAIANMFGGAHKRSYLVYINTNTGY